MKTEIKITKFEALFLLGVISTCNRESKRLRDIEKKLWIQCGYS